MPRSITADRLRERFNSVDKKFYDQIKKDNKISGEYTEIGAEYDELLKIAKDDSELSADLEPQQRKFFELKGSLGSIQCQRNSLELSPTDEGVVQENDTTLLSLKKKLDEIDKEHDKFSFKKSFPQGYKIFRSNLKLARKNWRQDTQKLQAAYYYNFADYVLGEIKSPELSKLKEKTEKAIEHLEKASYFYKQTRQLLSKKQTDSKITEVKKTLERLQLLNPSGWTVRLKREEQIEERTKLTELMASSTQQTTNTESTVAILKQQAQDISSVIVVQGKSSASPRTAATTPSTLSVNEQPTSSKSLSFAPVASASTATNGTKPAKKNKIKVRRQNLPEETASSLNVAPTEMARVPLEKGMEGEFLKLEEETFQAIEKSLEICSTNPIFYLVLLGVISEVIPANSFHNDLTRLRLEMIVAYVQKLPKGPGFIKEIAPKLKEKEAEIRERYGYATPVGWKFLPENKLLKKAVQNENEKRLLILSELKIYYHLKAINLDNESQKNLLKEIFDMVEKSIENVITKRAAAVLSYLDKLAITSDSDFCRFLSTLAIFSPSLNKNWEEKTYISIGILRLSYISLLRELMDFSPTSIATSKSVNFFKMSPSVASTKEEYLKELARRLKKEYLKELARRLHEIRNKIGISRVTFLNICEDLLEIIKDQFKQFCNTLSVDTTVNLSNSLSFFPPNKESRIIPAESVEIAIDPNFVFGVTRVIS
jgi:hypothetical protein